MDKKREDVVRSIMETLVTNPSIGVEVLKQVSELDTNNADYWETIIRLFANAEYKQVTFLLENM